MSKLLDLPQGKNSLVSAYETAKKAHLLTEANELCDAFAQHFTTTAPPVSVQAPSFERFSLIDPTVRTFVRSSTVSG